MKETNIMKQVQLAASENDCRLFRANVGTAWTGNKIQRLPNGDVLIKSARPFNTGLPKGFSDLFGFRMTEITSDMIGEKIPVFIAVEVKTKTGKPSREQVDFIDGVKNHGGIAGIVRSAQDLAAMISQWVCHVTGKNDK